MQAILTHKIILLWMSAYRNGLMGIDLGLLWPTRRWALGRKNSTLQLPSYLAGSVTNVSSRN